jgi:DNA-binding protein H-NS
MLQAPSKRRIFISNNRIRPNSSERPGEKSGRIYDAPTHARIIHQQLIRNQFQTPEVTQPKSGIPDEMRLTEQPQANRFSWAQYLWQVNMKTLIELQSQIASLQKQAAEIRLKETDRTIQEILSLMKAFGITHADLRRADGAMRRPRKTRNRSAGKPAQSTRRNSKPVPAKYIGPAGETWSGRGRTPVWLQNLAKTGHTKEEYQVKTSVGSADGTAS